METTPTPPPLGELAWRHTYVSGPDGNPVAEYAIDDDRKFFIVAPVGNSEQARTAAQSVLDSVEPGVPNRHLLTSADFAGIVHTGS